MHLFERFNALKLNFTHKGVDEKADIEVRMGEDGKPVIDAGSGAIGGGLPEGGDNGDVIVRTKVGGVLFGHAPDFESGTIRKMYVNLRDLKYANFDGYGSWVYLAYVVDTEHDVPFQASVYWEYPLVTVKFKPPFDDYGAVITVNTSDFPQSMYEFELDAHSAYMMTETVGGSSVEKIEGDTYIFSQDEYYGTVAEEEGVDFNNVIHYISFDEPFDGVEEEVGAEWRPLPIVRCEFTESANGAYATCNMTYEDIIDAYVNNKKLVVGNLVRSGSGVSKTVTVIASSFGDGDGPEFKMSPLLPTDFFKYLYYSADGGLWYIMTGLL